MQAALWGGKLSRPFTRGEIISIRLYTGARRVHVLPPYTARISVSAPPCLRPAPVVYPLCGTHAPCPALHP